ncbi:hypothetical protein BDB01DRAFT_831414 [Pilobolus umbonatus]|nr:hypothetical protein BDB01DRAFT_831414 [Pilobolus umbonatus]
MVYDMADTNQQLKRKSDMNEDFPLKRSHMMNEQSQPVASIVSPSPTRITDYPMEDAALSQPRCTTPPLSMTLSHYDPTTGTHKTSSINSMQEVKSPICTGMTPVYRAPFERWGSCLL